MAAEDTTRRDKVMAGRWRETMLEIRGLTKHYGQVTALDGASLTARRGRLLGFLGPNGAGKTTTMRCIFGLAVPEAGRGVLGRGGRSTPTRGCGSGTCPSSAASIRGCGSASSWPTSASTTACPRRDATARANAWLERFGLADRTKSKLEDLSHGNQQRIQLATALVHDPELLVLDEPFSGLDPLGVATMTEVLRERAAAGVGVVFSSHQLDLVEEMCEDVVIVSRGRVVADGEIGALKAASGRRHLEVEVVGSNGAWLDGRDEYTVLERDGDWVKLLVDEHADLAGILLAARAAGEVRRFSFEPPKLSELFMEAVTAPQPGAEVAR